MRLDDAITLFLSEWPITGSPPGPDSRRRHWHRPSPATLRTYSWQLKWLVGFAAERGQTKLADLTPELLRAAMAAKASAIGHPPTHKGGEAAANSLVCATRALARWLLAQGVPVADLESIKPPVVPERIQPRVRGEEFPAMQSAVLHRLVQEQRSSFTRALVERDLAIIHLLYDTGLRAFEVCSMTLDGVDFQTGSVLVARGKGAKPRALSIIDAESPDGGKTLQLLAAWIRARASIPGAQTHTGLWVNDRGKQLNGGMLRAALRRICAAAGLDGNRPPHAFRRANFTEHYLDDPRAVDVLVSRMGWSEKYGGMVSVYTRGAQIDFARTTPLPSLSARWGQAGPKVPYATGLQRPMLEGGVGPPWAQADDAPPPSMGRRDGERAAGQPARGRRPYPTVRRGA